MEVMKYMRQKKAMCGTNISVCQWGCQRGHQRGEIVVRVGHQDGYQTMAKGGMVLFTCRELRKRLRRGIKP
ncbi:hypothetical protein GYH30_016692 [Glycine max]|uniref:Uncharacterized protein n=1 Tax=Glycine max TaxID=3847 RepID=A0A0R0JV21_SOYBN|nr:hypothetical protein GYH30_016692 [Glycine max]